VRVKPATRISAPMGTTLRPPRAVGNFSPCHNRPVEILYRDEALAVLAKPSGLLVHRGWDDDAEVAVTLARLALGKFVYPVHRLDRGAGGALVFALSSEVAAALHTAFEDGRVESEAAQ